MKVVEPSHEPLRSAPLWPLSVPAYRALGEAGLVPKNTELLYGFVYTKVSKSPYHSVLVQFLFDALHRPLHAGMLVRLEQPIACEDSEPEPDLAVVIGKKEDYRQDHPHTAELVIEVCVTSHDYDRSKIGSESCSGGKEVSLVVVPEKQIEDHRQPAGRQMAER